MNIVLIGYRGSGKSTVAGILENLTGMRKISTDAMIEGRVGMTISEFVKKNGWEEFRNVEEDVIKEVSRMDKSIIDTGGGVVLRESNITALRENGKIFFLKADPKILAERIKQENTRPPLIEGKKPWEEIEEVLKERMPLYKKAADYTIDTGKISPEKVADKIIKIFKNYAI